MAEGFSRIFLYLQYPVGRYAFIVAILIALCSSLLGVTLVLKRFSFIGDGLSHVAFGYLLMNLWPSSSNISGDVCTTLFGSTSILTLKESDVLLCIFLSLAVIAVFILFYNRIFAVTFDEAFALSAGISAERVNLLIAVIIAVIIVLAMNLVGSLLISALVIFPALSAMRIFKSFKSVTICSAILSVAGALIGLMISVGAATPVGSTIVAVDVLIFTVCAAAGKLVRVGHA